MWRQKSRDDEEANEEEPGLPGSAHSSLSVCSDFSRWSLSSEYKHTDLIGPAKSKESSVSSQPPYAQTDNASSAGHKPVEEFKLLKRNLNICEIAGSHVVGSLRISSSLALKKGGVH